MSVFYLDPYCVWDHMDGSFDALPKEPVIWEDVLGVVKADVVLTTTK